MSLALPMRRPLASGFPSWLPIAAGLRATSHADFVRDRYWDGHAICGFGQAPFFAWLRKVDGAFARSSAGSRFDGAGKIETVAGDQPRFDRDPLALTSRGLLLEGETVNLKLQSERVGDVANGWGTFNNPGIGLNTSETEDPAGGHTATKLASSSSSKQAVFRPTTVDNGAAYTFSLFAKAGTGSWISFDAADGATSAWFNLATGSIGTVTQGTLSAVALGNGWYCLRYAGNSNSTSFYNGFSVPNGDNTSNQTDGQAIYVWGASLVAGAVPSSYIPTTSSAVARAAESLTRIRPAPALLSKMLQARTAAGAGTQVLWQLDDGSEDNRVRIMRNTSGEIRVVVTAAGADVADLALGAVADATSFILALRVAENDVAASLDGNAIVADPSSTIPVGLVHERWGSDSGGDCNWFGHLARDSEWRAALPDCALMQLAA